MSSVTLPTTTLSIGSNGAEVKELQTLLLKQVNIQGLSADGDFGEITQLAVRVFQLRNFLAADGIVGPQTRAVLVNGGVGHLPILRRNSQGEIVERLQRAMSLGDETGPANDIQQFAGTRGFYFGNIDGDFGPATEKAVKALQQSPVVGSRQPLSTVDGIVGPKTWEQLKSLVALTSHVGL